MMRLKIGDIVQFTTMSGYGYTMSGYGYTWKLSTKILNWSTEFDCLLGQFAQITDTNDHQQLFRLRFFEVDFIDFNDYLFHESWLKRISGIPELVKQRPKIVIH